MTIHDFTTMILQPFLWHSLSECSGCKANLLFATGYLFFGQKPGKNMVNCGMLQMQTDCQVAKISCDPGMEVDVRISNLVISCSTL